MTYADHLDLYAVAYQYNIVGRCKHADTSTELLVPIGPACAELSRAVGYEVTEAALKHALKMFSGRLPHEWPTDPERYRLMTARTNWEVKAEPRVSRSRPRDNATAAG